MVCCGTHWRGELNSCTPSATLCVHEMPGRAMPPQDIVSSPRGVWSVATTPPHQARTHLRERRAPSVRQCMRSNACSLLFGALVSHPTTRRATADCLRDHKYLSAQDGHTNGMCESLKRRHDGRCSRSPELQKHAWHAPTPGNTTTQVHLCHASTSLSRYGVLRRAPCICPQF